MNVVPRSPMAVLNGLERAAYLSASEQHYYHDAPVAHVLAYETRVRDKRLQRQVAGIIDRGGSRPVR